MTTARLLVNIVWRTVVYGLWVGALVGSIYGALLWTVIEVAFSDGNLLEDVMFALTVDLGTNLTLGALYGVISGLPLGLIDGVLLAVLIPTWFHLFQRGRGYGWAVRLVVGSINVIAGLHIIMPVFEVSPGYTNSETFDYWGLTVIPALIAGAAGWWVSHRIARWYEREMAGMSLGPLTA